MSLYQHESFDGSALECARNLNGLSLDELSRVTLFSSAILASMETNRYKPSQAEIVKLSEILNVKPKFFNQVWVKPPEYAFHFRNVRST